jgi:hypothetical protein
VILDFELDITELGKDQASLFWTVREFSEENALIKAGTYLVVVNSTNRPVMASFWLKKHQSTDIKVILENRKLVSTDGNFSDSFAPYGVHIYNLK